ncbi:acylphosphatase [Sulfurovum sp. bin170]|uniref:acylphosphatase n=1 Tax=Sulfurovum sp. bin170 TaxID=2695268 RepID=UPI0013DEEC0B|nr:acylphosphatase [Sulfurovum sp. bin170]NEW61023.1 acylphosphatase [Sulfurovum sp. bin170]
MEVYRFIVRGRVQGVWYRKFVSQGAMKMQIEGYVKNLADGTVESVAVLFDEDVEKFKKILQDGSPLSSVESIEMSVLDNDDLVYDGFEIRR